MNLFIQTSNSLLEDIDAKINQFSNSYAIETETPKGFSFDLFDDRENSCVDSMDQVI